MFLQVLEHVYDMFLLGAHGWRCFCPPLVGGAVFPHPPLVWCCLISFLLPFLPPLSSLPHPARLEWWFLRLRPLLRAAFLPPPLGGDGFPSLLLGGAAWPPSVGGAAFLRLSFWVVMRSPSSLCVCCFLPPCCLASSSFGGAAFSLSLWVLPPSFGGAALPYPVSLPHFPPPLLLTSLPSSTRPTRRATSHGKRAFGLRAGHA